MELSFKIKRFQLEIELESEKEFHSLSNQFLSLLRGSFPQRLQSRLNAIENKENPDELDIVKAKVKELCRKFPVYR